MCIRGGKQLRDSGTIVILSRSRAGGGGVEHWPTACLPASLTAGFDGAHRLKWFSGDGSSVWCQRDRGGAPYEGRGGADRWIKMESGGKKGVWDKVR